MDIQKPTKDFIEILKNFKAWSDSRNVTVLFSFPNIAISKEYYGAQYQQSFLDIVKSVEKMGIGILGSPYDAMVDEKYLFDTGYHLTQEGIRVRTEKLIDVLKKYNNKLTKKNNLDQ